MTTRSFIIAGESSGAGKTTIAMGLMAALKKRGFTVQPFKAGPDYIDPIHHRRVCGRPSYNLDTWMMGVPEVKRTFESAISRADVGIVEGVMGLFDGKDGRGEEGSTAHLAKVLNLAVILVVDASKMARSAAALVYGFEKFDPEVKIAGVIFNRVGSERHFTMLKEAVENRCHAKVYGYLPGDKDMAMPERHLGLCIPPETTKEDGTWINIERLSALMEKFIDIEGILGLRTGAGISGIEGSEKEISLSLSPSSGVPIENAPECPSFLRKQESRTTPSVWIPAFTGMTFSSFWFNVPPRIAVAFDDAFCFYYQQNLDILQNFGAEIIFFSPLSDRRPPERTGGIYLGGGYPELYAKRLEANRGMRKAIKDLADKGLPIYAECGGLMYLGEGLMDLKGDEYKMAGVFPWVSRMGERKRSLGYREVKAIDGCPFLEEGERIRGHEFHYSEIDEPPDSIMRVYRDMGEKGGLEGYLSKNTLASYIHLHFASNPGFAQGFVKLCSAALSGEDIK